VKKSLLLKTALAIALASPLLASAESQSAIGNGDAAAKLDFRVVIPRVLFLAVGTGSDGVATNTTVPNRLDFTYTEGADVGTGTDSAQQSVDVRVRGNNGQIAVAATGSDTGLVGATPTDIIPWTEILATSDSADFPVPAVGASANPKLNGASKVTTQATTWKYAYSNTNLVAFGTYNGTITYTASMP
jgi:hypothetical protein